MVYALFSSHNRLEYTKKCIKSLLSENYKPLKLIVVDDGSTDGTSEFIKMHYPDTVILKGDGNLFWTGSMRMGIEYILSVAAKGDYILLLNDDTIFSPKYIQTLVDSSEKYGRIPIGTILKSSKTGKIMYNSHKQYYGKATNYYNPNLVVEDDGVSFNTYIIHTKGTLVPIEVFHKIGNFSKLFPHYGADYDFFHRVKKNGYRLAMHTNVITYTLNDDKNLSERIREKKRISLNEFNMLFFSKRSSSNLYSTFFQIILHAPVHMKFIGLGYRIAYVVYYFITRVRTIN